MKKSILPIISIGLMTWSCSAQQKTSEFEIETEKWKKELIISREVGNPCREDNDWQKWEEDNPKAYFGLQEIQF